MAFAVFIYLVFKHLLFADIVGNHALCSALCRQLGKIPVLAVLVNIFFFKNINEFGECRSNPYSLFVLYALDTLFERFFNNKRKVCLLLLALRFAEIHKYGNEWSLSVCCKKSNYLILNCLNASSDFISQTFFSNFCDLLVGSLNAEIFSLFLYSVAYLFSADLNERSKMSKRN